MKEETESSEVCHHHRVGFLGLLITLGIVFGDIFYVVFLSIIIHYVIDCGLTLISQSETFCYLTGRITNLNA